MAIKHEESQQPDSTPLSQTRRSALKKMLVGTGVAAGAAALPSKWTKPIVDKVLVPAHAQTSTTTTVPPQPEPEYTIDCTIGASCGQSEGPPPNNGFPVTVTVTGTVTATLGANVVGLGITYRNDLKKLSVELDHETGGLATNGVGGFTITSLLYAPEHDDHCGLGDDLDVFTEVTLTLTGQTCNKESAVNCTCPPE